MAKIRKRRIVRAGKPIFVWVADLRAHGGGQPYFAREKDAKERIAMVESEARAGTYTPDRETVTLLEAGNLWLERLDVECAESYAHGARNRFNKHVRTAPFVNEKLSRLKEHMISDLFNKIAKEVSLTHAHTIYKEIKQIIALAKKRRLCSQGVLDVVDACKPKRLNKRKKLVGVDIPLKSEVELLLNNAPRGWRHDLFTTAAFTGMRSGELRALDWANVDFDGEVIRITHSAFRRKLKAPKSDAGVREIPMPWDGIVYKTLWHRAFDEEDYSETSPAFIERCIKEGERLLKAKAEMKRGEFMPWLAEDSGRSLRTSRLYMQMAQVACQRAAVASNVVAMPTTKPKPTGPVFLTDRQPRQMLGTAAIDDAFAKLQISLRMFNTDPTRVVDRSGIASRTKRAAFDAQVMSVIREIQATGITSALGIAKELTRREILTPSGGSRWNYGTVQNILGRTVGAAPRYDAHALRHFAASLFIEQGESLLRVQQIMGHSSARVTLEIYGHLFAANREDERKRFATAEASVFATSRNSA